MNKYLKEGLWFCVPIVIAITTCTIWFKTIFDLNPYLDLPDGVSLSVKPYYFIAAIATVFGFIIFLSRNLFN